LGRDDYRDIEVLVPRRQKTGIFERRVSKKYGGKKNKYSKEVA
jgi:hypothetical protein